jgi:agmatinase
MRLDTLTEALREYRGTVALIGFPFDHNSSYLRGSALAPSAIRSAFYSDSSNLWTESGINLGEPAQFLDAGDLEATDDSALAGIAQCVSVLLDRGVRPVCLGGDHSVTYPILQGFKKRIHPLTILHFDAHPDLYDNFEGNPHSHASPFARILENGLATRLVQVGIRTMNRHQREQAKRFGVEVHEMKDWGNGTTLDFDTPVYISFDLDSLDPAFAPGVSHPEGGGLSTREVVSIIQKLKVPIAGADIVELNPTRDPLSISAHACAKILKELLGKALEPTSHMKGLDSTGR